MMNLLHKVSQSMHEIWTRIHTDNADFVSNPRLSAFIRVLLKQENAR
jgi:hypothetical protein